MTQPAPSRRLGLRFPPPRILVPVLAAEEYGTISAVDACQGTSTFDRFCVGVVIILGIVAISAFLTLYAYYQPDRRRDPPVPMDDA